MNKENNLSKYKEKITVGARVNKCVVDIYKSKEIPVSIVIEASMINFLKLNDREKIKFISANLPKNTNESEFKIPKRKWNDLLEEYLKNLNVPTSMISGLLTGVAIGAVGLIGGILSSKLLSSNKDLENTNEDKNKL